MKFVKVSVIIILFFVVFSLISISFYLKYHGKYLLQDALIIALDRDVKVGDLSINFPVGFSISDFEFAGSNGSQYIDHVKAKRVVVKLDFRKLLEKSIKLNELIFVNLDVSVTRSNTIVSAVKQNIGTNKAVVEKNTISDQAKESEKKQAVEVFVDKLIVVKGRLFYKDSVSKTKMDFLLNDLNLTASSFVFPMKPTQTEFSLNARLLKEDSPVTGGLLKGKGWVDISKKDMEAQIEVFEEDGRVGMIADVISKNNDMTVKGEVSIKNLDLGFSQKKAKKNSFGSMFLGALSSNDIEVKAQYSFKTKMNDVRVDNINLAIKGKVGTTVK